MIEIITEKGEVYSFDPSTERVFKNNQVVPSSVVEPIYSDIKDNPRFSGLYFKEVGNILSLSGKYNPITDINSIY